MDPEVAFIELGQDGTDGSDTETSFNTSTFFQTNLEQRVGMIGSGVVIALSLVGILYLVFIIRRKDQRASSNTGSNLATSGGGGMFDKNLELTAEFPYSQLSNDE